ncbi:Hypothetical protein D9617_20g026730 [Elsinoe fawcettii]|nr:Hypothetical protein D9617_20g026730 [Elsinoe fawcettii]
MESSKLWHKSTVTSPKLDKPVQVIVAQDIPYLPDANRLQNLTIYLPLDETSAELVDKPLELLPIKRSTGSSPWIQVHVHGGAWRDPSLLSSSIAAAVAHTFNSTSPIDAIVSVNYTLSPFPSHPTKPYTLGAAPRDYAREAMHPKHIHDVLRALQYLRALDLRDGEYILTGHSAGACLAMQASLFPATHWGLGAEYNPPRPAAVIGMNGLYDLNALVSDLGSSHQHLGGVYDDLIGIAFGDKKDWDDYSPVGFDGVELGRRVTERKATTLVVIDQSREDQLVPTSQAGRLMAKLKRVEGLKAVRGSRCVGRHAAPWEDGYMICELVEDTLQLVSGAS